MAAATISRTDSYAQFIAVLVIFVAVLALTAVVTKWIARYQKNQSVNCNIEVLETTRIANNKFIQIVRIGETYAAIAVCRDSVTMLCEVPAGQLKDRVIMDQQLPFKDLFVKALKKDSGNHNVLKDKDDDE